MFAGKAKAYLKHLSGTELYDRLLALPANIRLKLETLASDKHSSLLRRIVNYDRKKFYNICVPVECHEVSEGKSLEVSGHTKWTKEKWRRDYSPQ